MHCLVTRTEICSRAQEAYDEAVVRHCRPLLEIYLLLISGLFFIPDHLKTQ